MNAKSRVIYTVKIIGKENYRKYSQLAQLNNEGLAVNMTLNENFAKTNHFVWVMATDDRIVWPPQGKMY